MSEEELKCNEGYEFPCSHCKFDPKKCWGEGSEGPCAPYIGADCDTCGQTPSVDNEILHDLIIKANQAHSIFMRIIGNTMPSQTMYAIFKWPQATIMVLEAMTGKPEAIPLAITSVSRILMNALMPLAMAFIESAKPPEEQIIILKNIVAENIDMANYNAVLKKRKELIKILNDMRVLCNKLPEIKLED